MRLVLLSILLCLCELAFGGSGNYVSYLLRPREIFLGIVLLVILTQRWNTIDRELIGIIVVLILSSCIGLLRNNYELVIGDLKPFTYLFVFNVISRHVSIADKRILFVWLKRLLVIYSWSLIALRVFVFYLGSHWLLLDSYPFIGELLMFRSSGAIYSSGFFLVFIYAVYLIEKESWGFELTTFLLVLILSETRGFVLLLGALLILKYRSSVITWLLVVTCLLVAGDISTRIISFDGDFVRWSSSYEAVEVISSNLGLPNGFGTVLELKASHLENFWLDIAMETGIFGLGLFALYFFKLFRSTEGSVVLWICILSFTNPYLSAPIGFVGLFIVQCYDRKFRDTSSII